MLGNTHLCRKEGINKNVWLLLRVYPRLHSATVSKVQKSHTGFAGRSLIGYSASVPDRFLQCSVKTDLSCDNIYMLTPGRQGSPTRLFRKGRLHLHCDKTPAISSVVRHQHQRAPWSITSRLSRQLNFTNATPRSSWMFSNTNSLTLKRIQTPSFIPIARFWLLRTTEKQSKRAGGIPKASRLLKQKLRTL